MARNRQRAKQRQAQRREERVAARDAFGRELTDDAPATRDALGSELDEAAGPIAGETGAPPENVGRSDTVAESPPPAPIMDGRLEGDESDEDEPDIDDDELAEADLAAAGDGRTRGPRGRRGDGAPAGQPVRGTGIGRVMAFLSACWAELQRVQWPDRRTLTQLTGIVLFFVILAGAYLGALDAVFSKLIQAIL